LEGLIETALPTAAAVCGQRQHRSAVAFEALADRLRVPAQPPLASLAALHFEVCVELVPAAEVRNSGLWNPKCFSITAGAFKAA
jgi:hypothetical protein